MEDSDHQGGQGSESNMMQASSVPDVEAGDGETTEISVEQGHVAEEEAAPGSKEEVATISFFTVVNSLLLVIFLCVMNSNQGFSFRCDTIFMSN